MMTLEQVRDALIDEHGEAVDNRFILMAEAIDAHLGARDVVVSHEAIACLDYTKTGVPIVTWFKPLTPGKHEVFAQRVGNGPAIPDQQSIGFAIQFMEESIAGTKDDHELGGTCTCKERRAIAALRDLLPADPSSGESDEAAQLKAMAEHIAASACPSDDSRLEIAYAIARHLKLDGWPCAWETSGGVEVERG